MIINFTYVHGSGNDFILIDCISNNYTFSEEDYINFTKLICKRNGNGGADGTLFLLPSKQADCRMRIFNADGSEPEMCGNGIRCIARKAHEILSKEEFMVETKEANLLCKKEEEIFPGLPSYSVLINNVALNSKDFSFIQEKNFIDKEIPLLSQNCKFSAVDMGNPHIIAKTLEIDDQLLGKLGEESNASTSLFPNGVNTSFFKVLGDQEIFVRTHERGVGLTNACGTAMSASSIVSCLLGACKYDEWIKVFNKGGMVKCKVNKDFMQVILLGNASFVYEGNVDYHKSDTTHDSRSISRLNKSAVNDMENKTYEDFQAHCNEYLAKR